MKKYLITAICAFMAITSCKMENPLISESPLPYGAPQFDKIRTEHYIPAFEQGIKEGKAEIDEITNNPEAPTFENTIEAMEYAGQTLNGVASVFYALMEANTNDEMQQIAEQVSPMLTEYSMYVSLNADLFQRVKAVYEKRNELGLDVDQMKLLEDTQNEHERLDRHPLDLPAVTGPIENGLIILLHRGEFLGADVKGIVNDLCIQCQSKPYSITKVFHIQKLITVISAAYHGEAMARICPIVKKDKNPQTLLADKGLWTDNGNTKSFGPCFAANFFGFDFCVTVRPDSHQFIGFVNRMFFRNSVYCR